MGAPVLWRTVRAARFNSTGKNLFAAGRLLEAKASFEHAAELGFASGYYNLGLLHGYLQQEMIGMDFYRRGFALDPNWERRADLKLIPNYVQIEGTRSCNAACIMCPLEMSPTQHRNMSDAHFERLATQITALPTRPQVAIHGLNEPLMDKKIVRRVRRLKELGVPQVTVVSNATLMTKDMARDLIDAGIHSISFSMETVDATTYEAIRLKLKLDDALRGIFDFIEIRNMLTPDMPIAMLFQYSHRNREHFDAYQAFWVKHLKPGQDQIALHPVHSFGKFPNEMQIKDNHNACGQIFTSMHLRAGGQASLCAVDVESEWQMGDATQHSLIDIFNCDRIRFDRHRHLMGLRHELKICADCDQPEVGKVGFGYNFTGPMPQLDGRFWRPGVAD